MPSVADPPARPRGRPFQSEEEREQMKGKIAETAQRMFQAEGYATVSMRRLAKEVGCSPMTLYKYYDGKIAVLQTLWAVVFDELFGKIGDRLDTVTHPDVRLRTFCQEYVGFWIRNPEHYRMVFMAEGVTQPEVSMFMDNDAISRGFRLLADTLAAVSLSAGSPEKLKLEVDLLISALHGIAHNSITISGYSWAAPEKMIDLLLEKLVRHPENEAPGQ